MWRSPKSVRADHVLGWADSVNMALPNAQEEATLKGGEAGCLWTASDQPALQPRGQRDIPRSVLGVPAAVRLHRRPPPYLRRSRHRYMTWPGYGRCCVCAPCLQSSRASCVSSATPFGSNTWRHLRAQTAGSGHGCGGEPNWQQEGPEMEASARLLEVLRSSGLCRSHATEEHPH